MNAVCSGEKARIEKRTEMWAKKWLLSRDRFTHLDLLNVIRNDSPEDSYVYGGLKSTGNLGEENE